MRLSRYGGGEPPGPETARPTGRGEDRQLEPAGGPSVVARGRPPRSSKKLSLPRKEVIQPHVPVRLPCYDFTPLTLHTFGTRLRVQTTRVV